VTLSVPLTSLDQTACGESNDDEKLFGGLHGLFFFFSL